MLFVATSTPLFLSISSLLVKYPVSACSHDLHQHQHLHRRQRSNTWQSAAQSLDPAVECAPYSYPPVQAIVKSYPAIWQIANLSQPGLDPQALQIYNQIQSKIPNTPVKGTPEGDFTATTPNYPRSDPDCWWSFGKCTTPKLAGLVPDVSTCPEASTFGLTLDDGPNCSHNAYYELLRQTNQKASLFYVGSNVIDWPLEAQRGLADGHEICSHTWSHRYMTGLTSEQAFAELYFSKKIIKDILGITVQCWRPPFGDVDDRIRFIAASLGLSTILWDNDVNDFRIATLGQAAVNANYQNILDAATRGNFSSHGTIVLSHELNGGTMNTSATYLPKIQQAFKYVVPVAVCQNNSQPYIETSYTYPTFAEWTRGTRTKNIPDPVAAPGEPLKIPSSPDQGSNSYPSGANAASAGAGARKSQASTVFRPTSQHFFVLGLLTSVIAGM